MLESSRKVRFTLSVAVITELLLFYEVDSKDDYVVACKDIGSQWKSE